MSDRTDIEPTFEARWLGMTTRLREALNATVSPSAAVRREVAGQSGRYRSGEPADLTAPVGVDAYLAARMPATVAATGAAMHASAAALSSFRPRSVLDAGCGPGSAIWAAAAVWPSLEVGVGVDRIGRMLGAASTLAARSQMSLVREARWILGDLRSGPLPTADLVVAAYLLAELPEGERAEAVDALWGAALSLLVIVEPGTPPGFGRIRSARSRLIEHGAAIAAPCPHDDVCPMMDPDWCHFGARLARSRLHRRAKAAEMAFEDEPYSYVAASRLAPNRSSRVLARPSVRRGIIGLRLCSSDGISERLVSRRDGELFRQARHAAWGSSIGMASRIPGAE